MKKIILGIMVGIIISCTVGVLASTIISSTNVTFQNKTVNMALDELYDSVNLLKTKGNAEANQILTGKKVIVKGQEITGTMANRGKLNWNPSSSTTYTVPAGYYSGGTISSSNAYSKGVTDADNRANTSSVNYQTGYNNGYNAGYTNRVITHLYSYSANTVTAMSIPLNLSGYSYILLQFENWQTITVWVNVGASINVWTPNNGTTAVSRTITATTSGITISATSNGSSCLHLRNIYGVK